MGFLDTVNKALNYTNPIGAGINAFNSVKNSVKGTAAPKVPALPAAPAPVQGPVQGPVRQAVQSPQEQPVDWQSMVMQSQYNQGMTNTIPTPKITTAKPTALDPSNSRASLSEARKALEAKFLESITGGSTYATDELAKIRLEKQRQIERDERQLDEIRRNKDGRYQGNLNDLIQETKDKNLSRLADLEARETAITSSIEAGAAQQTQLVNNLKAIKDLTGQDPIGAIQQDPVTGDYFGFFQTPEGTIESQILASGNVEQEYLSVNEAEALGVPYGTTKSQAMGMGMTPGMSFDSSGGNSEVQALAQDYAATGTRPPLTSLPKGVTFGQIASAAKDLPKRDGTLVSAVTGVVPPASALDATQQKGIIALSEIVRSTLPSLQEVYPKLVTGGSLNPWTTQDRQNYNTWSQEFLSKLLVARSGAAVTEPEYERYSKMLPKNLDQLTGTGAKKLSSLLESMTKDLDNQLVSNQLSIVGYSKVNTPYGEFLVGQEVEGPSGKARVNADGSLAPIGQSFSSAGNASASTLANAIKKVESGGNYGAQGASGEFGAYQFLPSTWRQWAGEFLGNPNASPTPQNQDRVALAKITQLISQGYGPEEIALIWNGGTPVRKKGVNSKGVAYDSGAYADKVLGTLRG